MRITKAGPGPPLGAVDHWSGRGSSLPCWPGLDLRLKALSGYGTADLQSFSTAAQYRAAFLVWPLALCGARRLQSGVWIIC